MTAREFVQRYSTPGVSPYILAACDELEARGQKFLVDFSIDDAVSKLLTLKIQPLRVPAVTNYALFTHEDERFLKTLHISAS